MRPGALLGIGAAWLMEGGEDGEAEATTDTKTEGVDWKGLLTGVGSEIWNSLTTSIDESDGMAREL